MMMESDGQGIEIVCQTVAHRPSIVVLYEDTFNWLSKMCLERMRQAAPDVRRSQEPGNASAYIPLTRGHRIDPMRPAPALLN